MRSLPAVYRNNFVVTLPDGRLSGNTLAGVQQSLAKRDASSNSVFLRPDSDLSSQEQNASGDVRSLSVQGFSAACGYMYFPCKSSSLPTIGDTGFQYSPTYDSITISPISPAAQAMQYCKTYLAAEHWGSGQVHALSISNNYALCAVSDERTGNMFLFKLQQGTYQIVASGKPMFEGVSDLQARGHMSASEASLLWTGLKTQLPGLGFR